MFLNYLKTALRNLKRNLLFSAISIAGLTLGLTVFILISIYIYDELSYDEHYEHSDRIYRVIVDASLAGKEFRHAATSLPLGQKLKESYPDVEAYCRLYPETISFSKGNREFTEDRFIWSDPGFFDVFTPVMISGDPATALSQADAVVLTRSSAEKYFGSLDVTGEVLVDDAGRSFKVTGVVEDLPDNSHFKYNMLGSFSSIEWSSAELWLGNRVYTYLLLKEDAYTGFSDKLNEIVKTFYIPAYERSTGLTYEQMTSMGSYFNLNLQPVTDIHFHSGLQGEIEPRGNISYIYIFAFAAIFILLLACINFMNLTTARSSMRSREVGLRKVIGSRRNQLVAQFLSESLLLAAIAGILAYLFASSLMPLFNNISGKYLALRDVDIQLLAPMFILLVLVTGLAAGSYPAFYLSGFRPVKVLKGEVSTGVRSGMLRKILVVFQFAVTIALISSALIVRDQISYIRNMNLGINTGNIVVLSGENIKADLRDNFYDELLRYPGINNVASSYDKPGYEYNSFVLKTPEQDLEYGSMVSLVDYNFAETFDIDVIDGRFFNADIPGDRGALVINKAAADMLGFEQAEGSEIIRLTRYAEQNVAYPVIGIVENFNYETLHREIKPLVMMVSKSPMTNIFVKISGGNVQENIAAIESVWQNFLPEKESSFSFLNDEFDNLYRTELRTADLFTAFSVIALIIAGLGLFGLAAFTTERRMKEIGIRKTLGAGTGSILKLLTGEFMKWVLTANLFAWPVTWLFMSDWLSDFAYSTDINIILFAGAGTAALIIAITTVAYQAVKAAKMNPVDTIKNE